MYPTRRCQDTKRGVVEKDTACIIRTMQTSLPWWERASARISELGLKQQDLLETFEVNTRGAIGHYLSGRREPSLAQFQRLAVRLGMTMDELLSGAVSEPLARPPALVVASEPLNSYLAIRQDADLVRELLAGVLRPLGLRLAAFEIDGEQGLRLSAEWSPPGEHRRGLDAVDEAPRGAGGALPGEITRSVGGRSIRRRG